MAGSGNNKQEPDFFKALSFFVAKRFPHLPVAELQKAIENGIAGKYNSESYVPISSITIFKWIEQRNKDYVQEENQKVEKTPDYHRLLFNNQVLKNEDTGIYYIVH